jgi:DNA-binding transcriptional regulator/RsmH inhibitor MraZ
MADLSITVNSVTQVEARAAKFALTRENKRRVLEGLPELANAGELIVDHLNRFVIPRWIMKEADAKAETENLGQLFKNADNATRAQVIALLNT